MSDYISPIGTLGLDTSGTYSSYDNYMPSTLGYSPYGYGGLGMSSSIFPSMYGGMGMMNPTFGGYGMNPMMQMMYDPLYYNRIMSQAERNKAQFNAEMHDILMENEVRATQSTNTAWANKVLTDGSVQACLRDLHNEVQKGNQDGVCSAFDRLKNEVYNKYRNEIVATYGNTSPSEGATQMIEVLYQNTFGTNLRQDIASKGDGALVNGFMKGFRPGHHERFVDETLYHCFGLEVDQRESKESRQTLGKGVGTVARTLEKGAVGAGLGIAGAGAATAIWNLCTPKAINFQFFKGGRLKTFAGIGAALGIGASLYNQITGKSVLPQRAS